jgi:hypothetical protein
MSYQESAKGSSLIREQSEQDPKSDLTFEEKYEIDDHSIIGEVSLQ